MPTKAAAQAPTAIAEPDPGPASIQMIEARHCTLSRLNVRKSAASSDALAELKADIAARGVLQNLIGLAVPKKTGKVEIVAGGRRLACVHALIADGVFPKTYAVPVLVDQAAGSAAEMSLAENLQREAMNPADACIAFRHCVEVDGASVEDVARRFGVTSRTVEGRLRLANLAPIVFEALRDGEISLEAAQAYGTTADQDRQKAVFSENQRYRQHHPASIRRQMVDAAVTGSDKLARLVGRDAYLAAGGRIEADLFGNDSEIWLDPALLQRLAEAKVAEVAAAVTGFAKVVPVTTSRPPWEVTEKLRPVRAEPAPLAPENEARVEALETRLEQLQGEYDAADEDDEAMLEDLAEQIEAVEREIGQLTFGEAVIPEHIKPQATAFVVIDINGNIALHDTVYVEREFVGDKRPVTPAGGSTGATGSDDDDSAPTLPRTLTDELAVQRRELLAIHLAHNTGVALDVMLFALADAETGRSYGRDQAGVGLMAKATPRGAFDFKVTGPLADEIGRLNDRLDRSWQAHGTAAARFDAFCALDDDARGAWAGWIVARCLDATLRDEPQAAFHNHLGRLLDIDVAAWWRPTAENYFGRIRKDAILGVLETVGGNDLKARYAGAKKAELASTAEKIMAGKAIIEPEIKAAAMAWVPEVMTFGSTGDAGDEAAGTPTEAGTDASTASHADTTCSEAGDDGDEDDDGDDEPADTPGLDDDETDPDAVHSPDDEDDGPTLVNDIAA